MVLLFSICMWWWGFSPRNISLWTLMFWDFICMIFKLKILPWRLHNISTIGWCQDPTYLLQINIMKNIDSTYELWERYFGVEVLYHVEISFLWCRFGRNLFGINDVRLYIIVCRVCIFHDIDLKWIFITLNNTYTLQFSM